MKKKKWFFIVGIPVMIVIVLLLVTKIIFFPPYEEFPVSGDYEILEETFTWTDTSRPETFEKDGSSRWLNVDFYYPANASEASCPLVVFSHGAFGISRSNYSTYRELASHGYIVASISHTYHAFYTKSAEGEKVTASREFIDQVMRNQNNATDLQEYEDSQEWMQLRKADMNFVLNTILEKQENKEGFFAAIDKEHIGLIGHSLGGATAVAIGRDRSDIDAVVDLDGTMLGEATGFENGQTVYRTDPYPLPILDIYGENHWDAAEELQEKEGRTYINFQVDASAPFGFHTMIKGSKHMNFTDLPLFSPPLASLLGTGTVDPKACISTINEIVLEFFDCYLKGEGSFSLSPVVTIN